MSAVLTVLWVLMWIIIWIFIVIFGLILLVLLLCVLPISYNVKAVTGEKTDISVRVNYLFRLVGLTFEHHEGKSETIFRIAWFKMGAGKKIIEAAEKLGEGVEKETEILEKVEEDKGLKKPEPEDEPEEKSEGGTQNILKTVKAVLTYPQGKTIIKLVFEALRKTGRIIWPKKWRVTGEVGFANPCNTGWFLGAYEAVSGALRLRDKVCLSGDFAAEDTVVRLNITARGSISIARLSIPIIWLLFKKPIRSLIKDLWRKGDSSDE